MLFLMVIVWPGRAGRASQLPLSGRFSEGKKTELRILSLIGIPRSGILSAAIVSKGGFDPERILSKTIQVSE